ncbi:TRAP transporter substrate-binding protein [Cobetia marina]|uniref:TRAP transporter substrate-binding protein n=1 Tax=Cobetia marina TaxID=28258 RepID=UPI00174BDBA2
MQRRRFLSALGAGAAGLAAAPFVSTANAAEGETIHWKMVTSWPKNFPALGTGANEFASLIGQLSGGRLQVKVYGAGEMVPALEVFDAVSSGTAQMGHSASYYWKGKVPAAQFFTAVPFGMNTTETNAWLYHGDGMKLWDEIYARHNLKPLAVGNTGTQMAGWFNKEVNSLADMKGLKIRLPGLAGEVMNRIGASAVNLPGSEIFTAMETGVIDATDWVGPYNDLAFGLHQVAKYYYSPAWNEPSAILEGTVNLEAWQALPEDLQQVVIQAARIANHAMVDEFALRNATALTSLVEEHGVELREFPQDVYAALFKASNEVLDEFIAKDEDARRVYESYRAFQQQVAPWTRIGEQGFLDARARVLGES